MANRERGEISLVADGRTYTLVLDTDAMVALEELFSTPTHDATWDEIGAKVKRGSVRIVRALIWAMLQRHHSDVSLKEAGHLIDAAGGLVKLGRVLEMATKSMQPDPEDLEALGPPANPPKAQADEATRGVGDTSTLTPVGSV
jgi:hypothetical protein